MTDVNSGKYDISPELDSDLIYLQESVEIIRTKVRSLDDVLQIDQKKKSEKSNGWFAWLRKKPEVKIIEPKSDYEIVEGWIEPIFKDLTTLVEEYSEMVQIEEFRVKYRENQDHYNSILVFIFNQTSLLIDQFWDFVRRFGDSNKSGDSVSNCLNIGEAISIFNEFKEKQVLYSSVYELISKLHNIIHFDVAAIRGMNEFIIGSLSGSKLNLLERLVELEIVKYSNEINQLIESSNSLREESRQISNKYKKYDTHMWGTPKEKERQEEMKPIHEKERKVFSMIRKAKEKQFDELLSEN